MGKALTPGKLIGRLSKHRTIPATAERTPGTSFARWLSGDLEIQISVHQQPGWVVDLEGDIVLVQAWIGDPRVPSWAIGDTIRCGGGATVEVTPIDGQRPVLAWPASAAEADEVMPALDGWIRGAAAFVDDRRDLVGILLTDYEARPVVRDGFSAPLVGRWGARMVNAILVAQRMGDSDLEARARAVLAANSSKLASGPGSQTVMEDAREWARKRAKDTGEPHVEL